MFLISYPIFIFFSSISSEDFTLSLQIMLCWYQIVCVFGDFIEAYQLEIIIYVSLVSGTNHHHPKDATWI